MASMYQEIDEIDQEDLTETRVPLWVWPVTIVFALCVGTLAYLAYHKPPSDERIDEYLKAEQTSYRAAITEPSAAMRRARLTDFLTTYPRSSQARSATALLQVLSAGEAEDWAALTEQIFDPKLSRDEKLASLEVYETSWGASLLGGRGDDITALREELSAEIKKFPSRKMSEDKTSVPETVYAAEMVGGPKPVKAKKPPKAPVIKEVAETQIEIDLLPKSNIIAPKLKKPSHPSYPRKAYRDGVSALVTVSLVINEKGKVKDVRVLNVEADRYQKDFAKASRRAAKKSRYHPKTVEGRPVVTKGHVKRYRFTPN